jgi:hypothetical protein
MTSIASRPYPIWDLSEREQAILTVLVNAPK